MDGKNRLKMKEAMETLRPKSDGNGGYHVHKNYIKAIWTGFGTFVGVILTLLYIRAEYVGMVKAHREETKEQLQREEIIKLIPVVQSEVKTLADRVNVIEAVAKEIPDMKIRIEATQTGIATLDGKVDVLLSRGR